MTRRNSNNNDNKNNSDCMLGTNSCGGDVLLDPNDELIGTSLTLDLDLEHGGSGSMKLTKPESAMAASSLFSLPRSLSSRAPQSPASKPAPLFSLSSPSPSPKPAPLFSLAMPPPQKTPKPAPLFSLAPPSTAAPLFAIAPASSSNNKPAPLFAIPASTSSAIPGDSNNKVSNGNGIRSDTAVTFASNSGNIGSSAGDITSNNNGIRAAAPTSAAEALVTMTPPSKQVTTSANDGGFYSHGGSVASGNNCSSSKSINSSFQGSCKVPSQSDLDDGSVGSNGSMSSLTSIKETVRNRPGLVVFLIMILGLGASTAFIAVGLGGAKQEQNDKFAANAVDITRSIEQQFDRYVTAAMYVHHYCRHRTFSRQDFRDLYESLIEDGLDFKAMQFDPNVTRDERAGYEAEAREYYAQNYPHVNYRGFLGFDDGLENGLVPTGESDFYFPIHYMEPVVGNEAAIDLDYYSHISRRKTLTYAFDNGEPAVTERLSLVSDPNSTAARCGAIGAPAFGVVMMHPGVNLTTSEEPWPRDMSSIVICIPSLLERAMEGYAGKSKTYIHDTSDEKDSFLGGVQHNPDSDDPKAVNHLQEIGLDEIQGEYRYTEKLALTNRIWTVTVVAPKSAYQPHISFVVSGAVLVLVASMCLALWIYTSTVRTRKFSAMKARVNSEKASLILENTRQAARAERELNDFIAHEVRNPVAAAMAACSFVKAAVNENNPLVDLQKRQDTREDVAVIYNSLNFINALLRNMLDMHRASHKQLNVNLETIDVYHDILQSTAGMIYQRDSKVKVIVECDPQVLFVMSDCLRLKQVILNLSRNATKFVDQGFIKLRGFVVDNEVRLAVEDSGVGIPPDKQDFLFGKFQESLDQLSQGTGIGLYLCKNLVELMGGEIYLDKSYNSGIPGCPGTSIIINLRRPPVSGEDLGKDVDGNGAGGGTSTSMTTDSAPLFTDNAGVEYDNLPDNLNVLFVDDDAILRKLFSRSVKRTCPTWTMQEASNGESALQLLDSGMKFDLIFVDQYMASIDKQMLGTETILEMRAQGLACRLFGLSANDLESEFIAAGADGFVMKPFPTETDALKVELLRAYYGKRAYYANE